MADWPYCKILAVSLLALLTAMPYSLWAQTEVIDPDLDRREVEYARIDNEMVELTPYVGALAIEDFDTSFIWGFRAEIGRAHV